MGKKPNPCGENQRSLPDRVDAFRLPTSPGKRKTNVSVSLWLKHIPLGEAYHAESYRFEE